MAERVTITEDFLQSIRTERGGYNKAQLNILGVMWPPAKGWKKTLYGKQISIAEARRLTDLKYDDLLTQRFFDI